MHSLSEINLKLKHRNDPMDIDKDLLKIEPLVDVKIIEETLCRIGIVNKLEKIIFPSCYLFKIKNIYYLTHFKELFIITRGEKGYNNISQADISRKNAIAFCLKKWNLINVDDEKIKERDKFIDIIPFAEKHNYTIQHKFNVNTLHQVDTHAGTRRPA
jgi:hypothetical protein